MKYYKIITDNEFIGVVTSDSFIKVHKLGYLCNTNEAYGQYLNYKGNLYRTSWMQPLSSDKYSYIEAMIYEIDKEAYDILAEAIEIGETIDPNPPFVEEVIIPVVEDETVSVEFAREMKIKELSQACNQTIEEGFDYQGSHYSLTQYDQINLINAELAVNAGAKVVLYHADNEVYREYSAAEITALNLAANEYKDQCLVRFNELKQQVNQLETIEEIAAMHYSI